MTPWLGIPEYTFILVMLLLPFTYSPISLLIFSQFAGTMTDINKWAAFVFILLLSNVVYYFRRDAEKKI